MSSENAAAVSAFIEGAPPGEARPITEHEQDIQKLTAEHPQLLKTVEPAFEKYNELQLATVKLPGSTKDVSVMHIKSRHSLPLGILTPSKVLISSYNSLGDHKYYDTESQSSFLFDHPSQVNPRQQQEKIRYLISRTESVQCPTSRRGFEELRSHTLSAYTKEHYPSSAYSVYPTSDDSELTIVVVANKYSPSNFWNGRWRSTYVYSPSASSLTGSLKVDVHYYEDGNVRLTTSKSVPSSSIAASPSLSPSALAAEITKSISGVEKKYQEELNKGFTKLSEGEFKNLRRQLPVTRQKIEWEKVGGYRLGQDIGSGKSGYGRRDI
ncbi:MAG: hypothetical protein Q9167_002091 [Letrouitia subvulpina]